MKSLEDAYKAVYCLEALFEEDSEESPGSLGEAYGMILEDFVSGASIGKVLKWGDLSGESYKAERLKEINNHIQNKIPFTLSHGEKAILQYADEKYKDLFAQARGEELRQIAGSRINSFAFFKTESGQPVGLENLIKTKAFGGIEKTKAESAEKQERNFIDLVNARVALNNNQPITLKTENREIKGVTKADKVVLPAGSLYKKEPYADIDLETIQGRVRLSAKMMKAPTLGSGGIAGVLYMATEGQKTPEALQAVWKEAPWKKQLLEFVYSFYKAAYDYYKQIVDTNRLQNQNLAGTKHLPDVNVRLPKDLPWVKQMLIGSEAMGGNIDYYFIGPDVLTPKEETPSVLSIDGKLLTAEDMMQGDLYFYIRKRAGDYHFTDETFSMGGYNIPKLLVGNTGGIKSRLGVSSHPRGKTLNGTPGPNVVERYLKYL